MLGFASEERLKDVLIAVGEGERKLEATRQQLCNIKDFALHSAFERVDRDGSNTVGIRELVGFSRDNGAHHITDEDCYQLVKFFDGNGSGKLSFQEFIQMFLPCEDNVLRNITIDRPSIRVGKFEELPRDIEMGMTSVIVQEVELARTLDALKRDLYACPDYSQQAAFASVDKNSSRVITTVDLAEFFREHNHQSTEQEVLAIIRRLDTDGDAAVNGTEWNEFLAAPPPPPVYMPPPPIQQPLPYVPPQYQEPVPNYYTVQVPVQVPAPHTKVIATSPTPPSQYYDLPYYGNLANKYWPNFRNHYSSYWRSPYSLPNYGPGPALPTRRQIYNSPVRQPMAPPFNYYD